MIFFSRYREYLNDNPEHFWFKRKVFGWGWVPATWQGWISLVIFLLIFIAIYVPFLSNGQIEARDVVVFLIEILAWFFALIGLCLITGEAPKWQWGIPERSEHEGK